MNHKSWVQIPLRVLVSRISIPNEIYGMLNINTSYMCSTTTNYPSRTYTSALSNVTHKVHIARNLWHVHSQIA
ncbi:hypothetical protein M951_chr2169 (nucleomorph) [Lotharella oceanica]|uniref:Uncharacterized protein n=1 Tax=Lotharella oceanica TaxID=641309 RepID=A0A060D7C7_9EUKA|nr:hypothetical protein M951_chr2169 [Lotharella oceanica]